MSWGAVVVVLATVLLPSGGAGATAPTGVVIDAGPILVKAGQRVTFAAANYGTTPQSCTMQLLDQNASVLRQTTSSIKAQRTGVMALPVAQDAIVRGTLSCPLMEEEGIFYLTIQTGSGSDTVSIVVGGDQFVPAKPAFSKATCPLGVVGPEDTVAVAIANRDAVAQTYTVKFLSQTGVAVNTQSLAVDPNNANVIFFTGAAVTGLSLTATTFGRGLMTATVFDGPQPSNNAIILEDCLVSS
jgi:hypothetical protein